MVYVPNPADPTRPTVSDLAGNMAIEFQALKGYIQSLIASGTNFYNIGGFRNRLKNGSFNVAQRGTSVTIGSGTTGYTLDQWLVGSTGDSTVVTQLAGAPNNGSNCLVLTPNSTSCTDISVVHRIESFDCQDLTAGVSITVSGSYLYTSDAILPTVALLTPTAQNNWNSSTQVGATQNLNFQNFRVGAWIYFTNTFILSADATYGLSVVFNLLPSVGGLSGAFQFYDVQVEKSLYATPFDNHPFSVDLALCQRFYQAGSGSFTAYASAGGQSYTDAIPFIGQMFNPVVAGHPTLTFTPNSVVNAATPTAGTPNTKNFQANAVSTGAGQVSYSYTFSVTSEL